MTELQIRLDRFLQIRNEANTLVGLALAGRLDWQFVYDQVFSSSISQAIRNLGFDFEYNDPDGSYEDDVLAYIRALDDYAENVNVVVAYNALYGFVK